MLAQVPNPEERDWRRILRSIERWVDDARIAFPALLVLQAKAVWGIWQWKDLSAGDTSYYFAGASGWAESLHTDLVWSPLYLVYYGSMQWIARDPFTVTLAHRLVLVAVVDVLVLALFRRLLPPAIAWMLAAWWAVLPINFDTLYEVHLFAAVPTLAAALTAASVRGIGGRAATLGVLLGATLFVRNEFLIASALWLVACVVVDGRRALVGRGVATHAAIAYFGALLAVAAMGGVLYLRCPATLRQLRSGMRQKHTQNVCQIYAFGYQQRHEDWRKSPWTECQDLMRRDFGVDEPTMLEAIARNPRAMLEHFAWNVRLIPSGVQLQLFDRASGAANPDYVPSGVLESHAALVLSLLVLSLFVCGAWVLVRERQFWWNQWVRDRQAGWAVLGCLSATALFVMIMQRPRPSYLFNESVTLMALVGMALCALLGLRRADALGRAIVPLAVILIAAFPSHYDSAYRQASGQHGQALRAMVHRLWPFRDRFAGATHGFLALSLPIDACCYLGGSHPCRGFELAPLLSKPPDRSPAGRLDEQGIDLIYANEQAEKESGLPALLSGLEGHGWERIAPVASSQESWVLLSREALP